MDFGRNKKYIASYKNEYKHNNTNYMQPHNKHEMNKTTVRSSNNITNRRTKKITSGEKKRIWKLFDDEATSHESEPIY